MILSFYPSDVAELLRRLAVLATLSLGSASATSMPDAVGTPSSVVRPGMVFNDFSASAASEGSYTEFRATLLHAKKELALAKVILPSLDLRDTKAESYVQSVKGILDWLERDRNLNFRRDAATLATSLEAARLRFGEETPSLNHWLLVHNPEGQEVIIPNRFVVAAEADEGDTPDYEVRAAVRAFLV
jgi:hypothetical protein